MSRATVPALLAAPGLALLGTHLAVHVAGWPAHTAALTGMPLIEADPVRGAVALLVGLTAPVLGPPLCAAALLTWLWPRR